MTPALSTYKSDVSASSNAIIFPLVLLLIYGFFSQYFFLSVVAGVVLTLIVQQFWKPYFPPALLYFFAFQWLQVFALVIYADYLNKPIEQIIETSNSQYLIAMTLIQLLFMSLASKIFFKKDGNSSQWSLLRGVLELDTKKILFGYLITSIIFPFLLISTRSNGTLNQLVQTFAILRNVFLILLAFILFIKRDPFRLVIIAIFIIEVLLGFASYFSSFKEVFLFLILVFLTVNHKIKTGLIIKALPIVALLFTFLVFWSHVKPEYRDFLNGGSRQQEVTVSKSDALNFLWKKTQTFGEKEFNSGVETLLNRLQAIGYYAEVYNRVPKVIRHTEGKIITESIEFVALPRFLTGNKGILDPSSKLSHYTGRDFKTAAEGTSISMGYLCDFYIDFGLWGMFIPVMLLGCLIGWMCSFLFGRNEYNMVLSYSLLIAISLGFATIESDIIFFIGVLRNTLVLLLLGKWVIFPAINRFIVK